jgi:hypothetical protein
MEQEKRTADDVRKDVALDHDQCAQQSQMPHFDVDIRERWFIASTIEGSGVSQGKNGVIYRHRLSGRPIVILYHPTEGYTLFFQWTTTLIVNIHVPVEEASRNIPDYLDSVHQQYISGSMEQVPEELCQQVQEYVVGEILRVTEQSPQSSEGEMKVERVVVKARRSKTSLDADSI